MLKSNSIYKYGFLFSMTFFVVFINSCIKQKKTHTINAEMLNDFYFNSNSFWIYKDSATGYLDTFYQNGGNPGRMDKLDYFLEFKVYSMYLRRNLNDSFHATMTFSFMENYCNLSYHDDQDTHTGLFCYNPLFSFPFQSGNLIGNNNNSTYSYAIGNVINLNASYTFNGKTYDSVVEISYKNEQGKEPFRDDFFCLKKNIGIVKMRISHPQGTVFRTFELVDYNVTR